MIETQQSALYEYVLGLAFKKAEYEMPVGQCASLSTDVADTCVGAMTVSRRFPPSEMEISVDGAGG